MNTATLPSRLTARLVTDGDCWIWTGCQIRGYGQWTLPGSRKRVYVHRYVYERMVGPIPDGLQLDHLCRTTACCNPAHLEPVTCRVNRERASAAITTCPAGHDYTPENTYLDPRGSRQCRTCRRKRTNVNRRAS